MYIDVQSQSVMFIHLQTNVLLYCTQNSAQCYVKRRQSQSQRFIRQRKDLVSKNTLYEHKQTVSMDILIIIYIPALVE